MKSKYIIRGGAFVCLVVFFLTTSNLFAQTLDDKREMNMDIRKLQKKAPAPFKLTTSAAAFFGYDSNVNLSPLKKGDLFEEFLFSAAFSKPLKYNFRFIASYDLDGYNYNHMTDTNNVLNHGRLGVYKKIGALDLGTGFDAAYFYYPNDENGTFGFYKCFASARQYFTKDVYQQLLYEAGYKIHTDRKALAWTAATFQNKELESRRQTAEYSLGAFLTKRLFATMKARFSINDSNAKFLNFYDYKTYEALPSISYKITDALNLYTDFRYSRRNYKSRILSTGTGAKEKDNLYTTNVDLRYSLNKNNILSLLYTYRNNATNEPLQEYTENVISVGWQYTF